MLEAIKLSKSFGDKQALIDLSIRVEPGEILCLLGANGAGKSTILNLLLNFIEPDSGKVIIDGEEIGADDKAAKANSKQKLVYIPEQVNLYQEFNALENLEYLAQLSGITVDIGQLEQALAQTGLEEQAWRQPLKDYSKGMRQKVGIAFAIVRQTKILLLDEPTSGLDPSATLEFIAIIRQLANNGAAILMVTHDFWCAHTLATHIGIMKQGRLVEQLDNAGLTLTALEQLYHGTINPQLYAECAA
jgi:ABC-2 type transport system ATP-binding protein